MVGGGEQAKDLDADGPEASRDGDPHNRRG